MAVISKGQTFATGDQVTALKLNNLADNATFASGSVDNVSTQLSGGAIVVKDGGVTTAKLNDSAVTTAKIADANVTKAKIENLSDYTVLGNVSGSAAAPAEVSILDEDDMSSDSAAAVATQQSIKAYVDGTSAFTTENGQSAGYQVFPSGLKMAWGDATAALGGTITFPSGVGFTVPPTIQISFNKGVSAGTYNGAQVGDVTITNFVYKGSYGNTYGPRYLAIGY
jgi:hypothetical protein